MNAGEDPAPLSGDHPTAGVIGVYRVVVRASASPEEDASAVVRLLGGLPDPPVYENPVAGVRGAAVVLPSGTELFFTEPWGGDGLLGNEVAAAAPGALVTVILQVSDVDRAVAALRARGAEVGDPVPTGRGRRLALVDPAHSPGMRLGLIQLPA